MKRVIIIFILMCVAFIFAAIVTENKAEPKGKALANKALVNKTVAVVQPQTKFVQTVTLLKIQLADIEAKKVAQKQAETNIEKEQAALIAKSDSLYAAAKLVLKEAYDKEMEILQTQDQALKVARDKLGQEYQDALKAVDEAKGIKK